MCSRVLFLLNLDLDSPVFTDKISEMGLFIFPEEVGLTESLFPPWDWVLWAGPGAAVPTKSRGPWQLMELTEFYSNGSFSSD